jgi:hypothetical protein
VIGILRDRPNSRESEPDERVDYNSQTMSCYVISHDQTGGGIQMSDEHGQNASSRRFDRHRCGRSAHGKNLKGRLLGFVLGNIGKGVLVKAFENSVKAIEAQNAVAREAGAA